MTAGATGALAALEAGSASVTMGAGQVLAVPGDLGGSVEVTPKVSSSVTSSSKSRSKFSRVSIFRYSLTSLDVLEETHC